MCEASKAGGIEWTMTPVNKLAAMRCPQSFSGIRRRVWAA